MARHPAIQTISESQLRSWADARVISSATFVEEMDRRRAAGRVEIEETPPLDFDLDFELDLDINELGLIEIAEDYWIDPFASDRPAISRGEAATMVAVALVGVALLTLGVWPWL